jgi:hypothetical protein
VRRCIGFPAGRGSAWRTRVPDRTAPSMLE